uniref:Uncharacterized protein n=1 Tax=Acrobeloides nanus TaxID=290746 RepID=A0A914DH59_9BILA
MLYHGPQAVVLVQGLAILAAHVPDPSLYTKTMDKDKIKRLADPGSFRTSLLHLANNMCSAFRQADFSMNTIRACLIDLSDSFLCKIGSCRTGKI